MSTELIISDFGGSGPKATAVLFVKDEQGRRPWAWVSNEEAAQMAPGMILRAEHVSTWKVETSYIKDGQEIALKVPRIQLSLGGTIEVDAPEADLVPEATFVVSDKAAAYKQAYLAKQAKKAPTVEDFDQPL